MQNALLSLFLCLLMALLPFERKALIAVLCDSTVPGAVDVSCDTKPSAGCCVPSNDDGQTPSPACCTIDGRTPKPSPVSPGLPIRPAELCIPHMAEYACGIAATGIQQDTPFFAAYRFPQRCASSRTSLLCVYLI